MPTRRALLAGLSTVLLSGCSSDGSELEPTPTPTPTPSPAPVSVELIGLSAPESVDIGESFQIKVELENTGNEGTQWSGILETAVTYGPEPDEWEQTEIELWIPAGDTQLWRTNPVSYSIPAVAYYRLENGPVKTTEIPLSKAPIVETTNLVSGWETFGDAIDNKISQAEIGSTITIASRFWYWQENQAYNAFLQVEVFDEGHNRVAIESRSSEQLTEENGWWQWESTMTVSTAGWNEGTYFAEMLIRDNQNDEVSNVGTTEFEII